MKFNLGNETSSNVVEALDSVDELETDLDQSKESMYKVSYCLLYTSLGYGMLFGSDVKKQFFQKRIKGRGYCDVGTSVISEFYTPLVPKGYDFLGTIGELAHIRPVSYTHLDVYKRQEFTWSYYDGYYNADNLTAKATRTWTTKTVAEKDSDGTIHYLSLIHI